MPQPRPALASMHTSAPATPGNHAGAGIPGRRTVTIQGRGSERYNAGFERRRPARRPHEREGFRPDRVAMWAVFLGLVLVLVAAMSSHAAVLMHQPSPAVHHTSLAAHHALTAARHLR